MDAVVPARAAREGQPREAKAEIEAEAEAKAEIEAEAEAKAEIETEAEAKAEIEAEAEAEAGPGLRTGPKSPPNNMTESARPVRRPCTQ